MYWVRSRSHFEPIIILIVVLIISAFSIIHMIVILLIFPVIFVEIEYSQPSKMRRHLPEGLSRHLFETFERG